MPNHVTHRMIVNGPAAEIARFKKTCIRTENEKNFLGQETGETFTFFDFGSLIPMPDEIKGTESSSVVRDGHAILAFDKGDDRGLRSMLDYAWVKEKGITNCQDLKVALLERWPNCVAMAERQIENLAKYGAGNWYDWSVANWGTKWNSYSFRLDSEDSEHIDFKFDTAWSPPEPVFHALAEQFPELDFSVVAFDEGWGFSYEGSGSGGTFSGEDSPADDEMYKLVYGHAPERYDEDDEDIDDLDDEDGASVSA